MKAIRLFSFLLIAFVVYSCANKVMPTGGPKDESPPVLLKASPPVQTINFNSNSIVLTFDEYIQLKDPQKQIVISPPIIPAPQFSVKKKSVVVEFKNPLAANTTYNINFSNAIVDINESTPLAGFQYTFSTGSFIDSLKVTGIIRDALTSKIVEGALAILYPETTPDSLILKSTPGYFSRTNAEGKFEISNVAQGRYRLFALFEKNNNYILDQADEKIGFITDVIELVDSSNVDVRIFKPTPVKQSIKGGVFQEAGKLLTAFARPVNDLSWKFISKEPDTVLTGFNEAMDSVYFYFMPPPSDSVKIVWFEKGTLIDTISYLKQRILITKPPATFARGIFYPASSGALAPETSPVISWISPIATFDTSKVKVFVDSIEFNVNVSFMDSLQTQMKIEGPWKEGVYKIQLLTGAVTDVYSLSNDSVTSLFSIPSERTKGSITIAVTPSHQNSYLLQLVNDKDEVIRQRTATGVLKDTFGLLDPAIYRFRMMIDVNSNGRWDPGDYLQNIQPETVVYYTDPIMVRANWEVELEWNQK